MSKLYIKNRYGQIPNEILNREDLSLKAKGMFGYLQAKPDGWRFSEKRLVTGLKEGKSAVRQAIKELQEFGYLIKKPVKDSKGKWFSYDYFLSENPLSRKSGERIIRSTDNVVTLSKKDNSNKEYSKKDNTKIQGKALYEGKLINEMISYFEPVNPFYQKLFGMNTQRKAIIQLLEKCGEEKLRKLLKALPEIVEKHTAPRISTPNQLVCNFGKLGIFLRQQRSIKSKYEIGSV